MPKEYSYIDLFAGCGGLSLGLHNAGWKGLFAVEKSPDAFKTLKYNLIDKKNHFNWPKWLGEPTNLEINEVIKKYKNQLQNLRGKVDLVAGGPPCQGFSMAGRR
ncbi:MAG: DNA cytosine methyltransferase, partial [Taibaiella sp.]|nr:DNA cytosine methyltransferase [Taibaiella sp.]